MKCLSTIHRWVKRITFLIETWISRCLSLPRVASFVRQSSAPLRQVRVLVSFAFCLILVPFCIFCSSSFLGWRVVLSYPVRRHTYDLPVFLSSLSHCSAFYDHRTCNYLGRMNNQVGHWVYCWYRWVERAVYVKTTTTASACGWMGKIMSYSSEASF